MTQSVRDGAQAAGQQQRQFPAGWAEAARAEGLDPDVLASVPEAAADSFNLNHYAVRVRALTQPNAPEDRSALRAYRQRMGAYQAAFARAVETKFVKLVGEFDSSIESQARQIPQSVRVMIHKMLNKAAAGVIRDGTLPVLGLGELALDHRPLHRLAEAGEAYATASGSQPTAVDHAATDLGPTRERFIALADTVIRKAMSEVDVGATKPEALSLNYAMNTSDIQAAAMALTLPNWKTSTSPAALNSTSPSVTPPTVSQGTTSRGRAR